MSGKPKKFASPAEWLDYYAIPIPESGCYLFEKFVDSRGYGKVSHFGKAITASRASYERFYGPIPDGMSVLHKCDVPACINPKHLFLGTQQDNLNDMDKKGRRRTKQHTLCKHGHPLEWPVWSVQGICRICQREAKRRYRERLISKSSHVYLPNPANRAEE